MKISNFLPVILGTDWNVYGVASSFHEAFGIRSAAIGMRPQMYTTKLPFLDVYCHEDFDKSHVFVEELLDFARSAQANAAAKNISLTLLLVSCSDYYTKLITQNKDKLQEKYVINCIDDDLRKKLENKKDFYAICEDYGLNYPDTAIVTSENYSEFEAPFAFPLMAKPNDSIKWFNIPHYEGYKKAYKVEDAGQLSEILKQAYSHGYDDDFIIQDYIPDDGPGFVVNSYSDSHGKVIMTSAARVLLEECLPADIGNYNALLTGHYPELTQMVKSFLEAIEYRGFANMDFRFDARDSSYKVFEINIRQGRSSYYMTAAGNNFVSYLVADMIDGESLGYSDFTDEHLWYITSKYVLKNFSCEKDKAKIRSLLREGKASYGLSYGAYSNIYRFWVALRRKLSTTKYYRLFG